MHDTRNKVLFFLVGIPVAVGISALACFLAWQLWAIHLP